MADTELQSSNAKKVMFFCDLKWECKTTKLLFQGKESHYNLQKFNYSAYDVIFERWSKVLLVKQLKVFFFTRLLQSQSETKYNVFNFSVDSYIENLAKMNALPVKEKLGENRR